MSKYGYLEVFQRVPSTSRYRESTVVIKISKHADEAAMCSVVAFGYFIYGTILPYCGRLFYCQNNLELLFAFILYAS